MSSDNRQFLEAVGSLKQSHRSRLVSARGKDLINKLYIDPLPDDFVLRKLLRPTTTLVLGRRGTGKSTLFGRAESEIRDSPDFKSTADRVHRRQGSL